MSLAKLIELHESAKAQARKYRKKRFLYDDLVGHRGKQPLRRLLQAGGGQGEGSNHEDDEGENEDHAKVSAQPSPQSAQRKIGDIELPVQIPYPHLRLRNPERTGGKVLDAARMTLDEVDLFILHQANMRIINSAVKDLGIDPGKVYNNLERYGNTSSASIPLALDEAFREGRIARGHHLLFSGFGAGLAWGTVLMRW